MNKTLLIPKIVDGKLETNEIIFIDNDSVFDEKIKDNKINNIIKEEQKEIHENMNHKHFLPKIKKKDNESTLLLYVYLYIVINILFSISSITVYVYSNKHKNIYNLLFVKIITDIGYDIFLLYHILIFKYFVIEKWIVKLINLMKILIVFYIIFEICWIISTAVVLIYNSQQIQKGILIILMIHIVIPRTAIIAIFFTKNKSAFT